MNIKPAILPHSFEEITEKLSRVEGLAKTIQIDLCDGVIGREKTWLPTGTETLPSGFAYEFDVMVNAWKTYIPNCVLLRAKSIIVHMDIFSDEDIATLVGMVAPSSILLGIAVSNDKSVDFHADMFRKVRELYPHVFIQVMGIQKIGEQSQPFDVETPSRVKALKALFGDVSVQVDGGITPETAKLVTDDGADTVVVGSYIFGHDDAGAALEQLNVDAGQASSL